MSVRWSPRGDCVATASWDRTARVFGNLRGSASGRWAEEAARQEAALQQAGEAEKAAEPRCNNATGTFAAPQLSLANR